MRHRQILGHNRHLSGWKPSPPDHRDKMMIESPEEAKKRPPAADLTPKCPPIRDQRDIGSCVANSSLEAMGFLYTNAGKADPQLSRLFTYYYTRKMEGTPPTEDSGCQIRDAMKGLSIYGSCLESTWPYATEKFSMEPPHQAYMEAQSHQILTYYRCASLAAIKKTIAGGHPVVGGFSVPSNMMSDACAKTGIVEYPGPNEGFEGGHAVLWVAYNDSAGWVKFQNSWGPDWGDHGYGYLPYRFFTEGLASDHWCIVKEEMEPSIP